MGKNILIFAAGMAAGALAGAVAGVSLITKKLEEEELREAEEYAGRSREQDSEFSNQFIETLRALGYAGGPEGDCNDEGEDEPKSEGEAESEESDRAESGYFEYRYIPHRSERL